MKKALLRFVDTLMHRWLHVPYRLHSVRFRSPKAPRYTIILLHGLGNSSKSWRTIARQLPSDVRVIGIDLLGFGESPKPTWATYTMATQVRAIARTVVALRLNQRVTVIGHSMGALVAIELAKRYPLVIKQLVLCSPPLYSDNSDKTFNQDRILRDFYESLRQHPDRLQRVAPMAAKLGIVGTSFNIQGRRVQHYVAALEAGIIHQTSLVDAGQLRLPITILYGTFDPVVIGSRIRELARSHTNIIVKSFPVGHEITGRFQDIVARELLLLLKN